MAPQRFQKNCATSLRRRTDTPPPPAPSASPGTRHWEPAPASPACGRPLPRAAASRTRNLLSRLSLLRRPLPLPQGQGQRRPPPSSPPLWRLQPGGGSDQQQLTQHKALPLSQPADTPWAQRRDCNTAATTQAAAPATPNCLPDHRDPRPSLRNAVVTNGRRIESRPSHLRDRLKLRQQLWRARGGGQCR